MNRMTLLIASVVLSLSTACSSGGAENIEAAENLEESAGDEAELIGDNPDDMQGWDTPGGEIEAEMESEPYPE